MPDDRKPPPFPLQRNTHPLLQQTPLSVNPFIDLPKPPTLPPTYASLPSTLPPSILSVPPTPSSSTAAELPAYVSSTTGNFSAHPSAIIAQNRGLLEQIQRQGEEGRVRFEAWEKGIEERELREARRRAPGWLDRAERILEPERVGAGGKKEGEGEMREVGNLMDADEEGERKEGGVVGEGKKLGGEGEVDDLGAAMDRAFGRSEMGG